MPWAFIAKPFGANGHFIEDLWNSLSSELQFDHFIARFWLKSTFDTRLKLLLCEFMGGKNVDIYDTTSVGLKFHNLKSLC